MDSQSAHIGWCSRHCARVSKVWCSTRISSGSYSTQHRCRLSNFAVLLYVDQGSWANVITIAAHCILVYPWWYTRHLAIVLKGRYACIRLSRVIFQIPHCYDSSFTSWLCDVSISWHRLHFPNPSVKGQSYSFRVTNTGQTVLSGDLAIDISITTASVGLKIDSQAAHCDLRARYVGRMALFCVLNLEAPEV